MEQNNEHHGLDADDGDAFQARMEDQCHQIEAYRQRVLRQEGRVLSPDEAGLEWVERFAEEFARVHEAPGSH